MTPASSPAPSGQPASQRSFGPWFGYIGAFYAVWLVTMFGFGLWREAILRWPVTLVMILGSVVAGSTPIGGGAVAFPFLVLLFERTPEHARHFALAIQALGMTSAMIFIVCRRIPIQIRLLGWTSLGAAAGVLLGRFALAPYVAPQSLKLLFSCLWLSFAFLTLAKNREICALSGLREIPNEELIRAGILAGLLGGLTTSLVGVGVEMMLYCLLVLRYRCDLKIAVPTAVSGMAIASVMGVGLQVATGGVPRSVMLDWLAAAPIVVFGAPFGAWLVTVLSRAKLLTFVAFLCVVQFGWTVKSVAPGLKEWAFIVVALAAAGAGFYWLYRQGIRSTAARVPG